MASFLPSFSAALSRVILGARILPIFNLHPGEAVLGTGLSPGFAVARMGPRGGGRPVVLPGTRPWFS